MGPFAPRHTSSSGLGFKAVGLFLLDWNERQALPYNCLTAMRARSLPVSYIFVLMNLSRSWHVSKPRSALAEYIHNLTLRRSALLPARSPISFDTSETVTRNIFSYSLIVAPHLTRPHVVEPLSTPSHSPGMVVYVLIFLRPAPAHAPHFPHPLSS
jgi:hypothetical protein